MSSASSFSLHLLDVSILPSGYVNDVIQGSWSNLKEGVSNEGKGRKVHGFKVVGENRLVAVLDGNIDSAVKSLNAAYGDQIKIACIPLRTYEGFAEHVLGVDKSLTKVVIPRRLGTDGKLFWLTFKCNYAGLSLADFIASWGREATAVLALRNRGDMEIDAFKVVCQREVHLFCKAPDAEVMDDISFTLPIMKEMGDHVEITTRSVVHLEHTVA